MKKMQFHLLICLLLKGIATVALYAQQPPIQLKAIGNALTIDGQLSEPDWFRGQPARQFWQLFPNDSIRSVYDTEVYMAYDDRFFYVGAKCYTLGRNFVIPSLRRDYRAGGNDNITFVFDTFRDKTNAIVFGMNPVGVTREALISNGGGKPERDFDEFWDNKWHGASYIADDYWSCELAIPFSSLRYKEGDSIWLFNCYRFDMQSNTQSTWNRIPQNQPIMSLGYMGEMRWADPLPKPKSGISLIPYVSGGYVHSFIEDGVEVDEKPEFPLGVGMDAKIRVSAGLNLDLTINPDFSQVEVDRQVVNLDRFEILFPERRQFFLENADLFATFGTANANPFFSRRIGVAIDTSTGQNIQNPIYGGLRLSGKIDNNWRVGLLSMQAAPDDLNELPSLNYTVAAVQRKIFNRSNLGFIWANKQNYGQGRQSSGSNYSFNRVAGIDYNLASADNRLTGKVYYHRVFTPDEPKRPFSHGTTLEFREKKYALTWQHQWIGEGFDPEIGFVLRDNFFSINPQVEVFFYPSPNRRFNLHTLGVQAFELWMPEEGRTDARYTLYWEGSLRNTAFISANLRHDYVYLFDDFDPSRQDFTPLPEGSDYRFSRFNLSYTSDKRPRLSYSIEPSVGQYFNGYLYALGGSVGYRYQPYGSVNVAVNYSYIDLPRPYARTAAFIIGPRIDFTFSKSVFLTAFVQYNDQIDNVNINARLQWRYAPVSDLFIVYTDNYNSIGGQSKNRAILAKITYWLNT